MNSSPSLSRRQAIQDRFIAIRPTQATAASLTYEDAPRQEFRNGSKSPPQRSFVRSNARQTQRKRTRSALPVDRTPARKRQRQFSDSLAMALFDDAQTGYEAGSSDLSDDYSPAVFSSSPTSTSAYSPIAGRKKLKFSFEARQDGNKKTDYQQNAFEESFYKDYTRFPQTKQQQQRQHFSSSTDDHIKYLKRAKKPLIYSALALHALDARGLTSDYTANSLSWTPIDAPTTLLATFLSGPQGVFHTWNPATLEVNSVQPNCHLSASSGKITALTWRSGGRQIATGSQGAIVSVYDIEAQACQTHLRPTPLDSSTSTSGTSSTSTSSSSYSTTSLSWCYPSSSSSTSSPYILANSYSNGHLLVSDIRCMNDSTCLSEPTGRSITAVEWDPLSSGVHLASATSEGRVQIWDSRNFSRPIYRSQRISSWSSPVGMSLAWSNTERGVLALANGGKEISFLRMKELPQDTKMGAVKTVSNVNKVLWARDSQTLITCHSTSTDTLSPLTSSLAIEDGQSSASISPQLPHPIKLYSFPSMQEIATLEGHVQATRHAALSSDGKKLVTGGEEEILKVWRMPDLTGSKAQKEKTRNGINFRDLSIR